MSIAKTNNPRVHGALALGFLSVVALGETGCIRDTDCGICDPDNLILESISGVNYASKKISLLGPTCTGDACPGTIEKGSYFVEEIGPCELTEDALASPRGAEEYCKISPLVVAFGIEFIFNNLLDATSVELVRKRPDEPNLFEVYDWKTDIIDIVGPTTRYNGDYLKGGSEEPDLVTRLVNLSCIDNLADQGTPFDSDSYADPRTNPCNQTRAVDGEVWPLKMRRDTPDAKLKSFRGLWTSGSNSCDSPQGTYDTCCNECDFVLSTKVAKYGLNAAGEPLTPDTALTCTAGEDPFTACRDFVVGTDRSDEERAYRYVWSCTPGEPGCEAEDFDLPWYDKIRETHPDDRPAHLEKFISSCTTSQQCDTVHGLDGTVCIGETPEGTACAMDPENPDCVDGFCRAQWTTTCVANADTTGGDVGLCVDRRFSDAGAGACFFVQNQEFQGQCDVDGEDCRTFNRDGRGVQLGACDSSGGNNLLTAAECCQESLGASGDGAACDPFFQDEVRPVPRYGRNSNLPEATRNCICSDAEQADSCTAVVDASCRDEDGNIRPDRAGEYAVLFVERRGGVVYDPALKGVEWRPADLGGVPRAGIEACAEARGLMGDRNRHDGWRENDAFMPESFEDFDRAMCSDSEYTVTFGVPGDREFIVDKVGNSLAGKNQYTFSTPEFHVVPGSGFPTDNLRIGACDDFGLRFSNKYDLSPENLRKIQLVRVDEGDPMNPDDDVIIAPNDDCPAVGAAVAGGPDCVETAEELLGADGVRDWCKAPCLTVNIENQPSGNVAVEINPAEFGAVLGQNVEDTPGKAVYRMIVPGLANRDQMQDPALYQAAFWDACGMPLILGGTSEVDFEYQFSIDPPQCKEDPDQDQIPLSCDNAPEYANPDQLDTDGDGVGDIVDLCPTVPSAVTNTADSDKDGVGNECDSCRQTPNQYNNLDNFSADPALRVRNIPFQTDTDQDGIGDACDNCVMTANCEAYSESNPYEVGDPIAYDDRNRCQRDDSSDGIGDACEMGTDGAMLPGSAGPVGFGVMDDFDQDGLSNMIDACPRQPVDIITCDTDADCGENRACEANGICNHVDSDDDGVGDICDTCPFAPNEVQVTEGGAQEDDDDGDFVGAVCESASECSERTDPRPFSFFEVAANGLCCTVMLVEDPETGDLINTSTELPLRDPDDLPIRLDCVEGDDPEARPCRKLPDAVAATPGILTPPQGCEEALTAAGYASPLDNPRIGAQDVPSLTEMWDAMCFLPQRDQDFDGLGDPCDLCVFDYDPENTTFVDDNGRVWPRNGAYCFGDYSVENKCLDEDTGTGTGSGTDTGTGTGTSGGTGVDTGGV